MSQTFDPPEPSRFGKKGDLRRQALIEAGYRVIQERGLANLTFRAVANEAGVPLGSASYYFADKVGLTAEIIRFARQRVSDQYQRLANDVAGGKPWQLALAELISHITSHDATALARDYEIFLYGFEQPQLQQMSRSWITLENPVLIQCLPEDLHNTISYLLEGIYLTSVKTGRQFSVSELLTTFGQIKTAET